MGKVKCLFLMLFLVGCSTNNTTENGNLNGLLYDYDVEEKIKSLNIELPVPGKPIANYAPTVRFSEGEKNNACICFLEQVQEKKMVLILRGVLVKNMTIEEGYGAAKLVGINILASLKKEIGDLNKIKRFVKVIGMVNSTSDFYEQPAVINGFSDFIVEVFGERGKHARFCSWNGFFTKQNTC